MSFTQLSWSTKLTGEVLQKFKSPFRYNRSLTVSVFFSLPSVKDVLDMQSLVSCECNPQYNLQDKES